MLLCIQIYLRSKWCTVCCTKICMLPPGIVFSICQTWAAGHKRLLRYHVKNTFPTFQIYDDHELSVQQSVTSRTTQKPCLATVDEVNHDHGGSRGTLLTWESPEMPLLTSLGASRAHWAEDLSATTTQMRTPQTATRFALGRSASVNTMCLLCTFPLFEGFFRFALEHESAKDSSMSHCVDPQNLSTT